MSKLGSLVLGSALVFGNACSKNQSHQSPADAGVLQEVQSNHDTNKPQFSTTDSVYAKSVLLNNHINYFRRELTAQIGKEKANGAYYSCMDKMCSAEQSNLSDGMMKKLTDKQMEPCFQDGDYDDECLDGTILRQFGDQYREYMEVKNRCSQIVARCLDKKLYPKDNSPYDPQGLGNPLDRKAWGK